MNKRKNVASVLMFFLISSILFSQETTGSMKGKVTDETGKPLPGVTVEITSPSLIGKQNMITDLKGNYFFVRLQPGSYTVVSKLDSFKTATIDKIIISLGKTSVINVEMSFGLEEEVTVIAKNPTMDITSSKLTTNINKDFFDSLPKGRNFQDMAYIAPGVTEDMFGIGISGSTGGENQFLIDGTNTTGVRRGTDMVTELVYEFVEEVQTKSAGYQAEYGGALGGIVNVITKSGGNEYHGEARFNYQSDKLYGTPKIGIFGAGAISKFNYYDISGGFGGYLAKDKLWFFLAFAPSFRTTYHSPTNLFTNETGSFKETTTRQFFSSKITYKITNNHKLTMSIFGDPGKITGGNPGVLRDWKSNWEGIKKVGSGNASLKYEATFGNSLLLDFLVGRYYSKPTILPISGIDEPAVTYYDGYLGYPYGWQTGGYGRYNSPYFTGRWTIKGAVTKIWGNHYIKGGFQYSMWEGEETRQDTGGYQEYYRPSLDQLQVRSWFSEGHAYTDILAFYLQDSWRVTPRLYLNLGIRIEDQKIHATDPSKWFEPHETLVRFSFGQQISPRLGFSYDIFGDGKSKFFGSYGKYFEMVPTDINIITFGNVLSERDFYHISTGEHYLSSSYMGGFTKIIDRQPGEEKMKAPFVEEFVLGFEKEIIRNLSISIRGIYRKLGRFMEDGSFDQGHTYFVFNPGVHLKGSWDTDPMGFPEAKREYKALEIVIDKIFSKNYQFTTSYVYSKLTGNMAGFGFHETGQNNPNIAGLFDAPEFLYNADGYLWGDRPHQFKFNGIYLFNFGLNVGASFRYHTGQPFTKMGSGPWGGASAFLEKRGTSGRLPNFYQLDTHFEYSIKLDKYRIGFYFDVFNVLNTKIETAIDTLYARSTYYGYPGGMLPPWKPEPQADNDYYGNATHYQAPARVMLGFKFQF